MTPARTVANGVRIPSLFQPWLVAMLRLFVELVSSAAATLGMSRPPKMRECDTPPSSAALPLAPHGIQSEEPKPDHKVLFVVTYSRLEAGLMVSLSNHEAVLTALACAFRASSFDRLRMRRSIRQLSLPAPA